MPKTTRIKSREEYLSRLMEEDKKIARKDTAYGEYITALRGLVNLTNQIYKEKSGELDKTAYERLVGSYLDVAQKGNVCKETGKTKARDNVIDHIQKLISKDLKALRGMDKEKLGNLDNVFENSRAVKVNITNDLKHRVGGQMSDRFPMKSIDGKKGFFTARTDTARDEKWNVVFHQIGTLNLPPEQMEKINALKTNQDLRIKLIRDFSKYKNEPDKMCAAFAVTLGFSKNTDKGLALMAMDKKLQTAFHILASEGEPLFAPYDLQKRLGYDPYTRNDNKNAAMYEVAKFLGCEKLVAKAVPMVVVNGNKVLKGTFMELADGSDTNNLKANDPLFEYDETLSPYNKDLYRDIADMQMLDYICGNVDRHKGNMCYKTKVDANGKVHLTGLVGIDNDASFPEQDIMPIEFGQIGKRPPRIFKPANFRYVTKKTADIVKNMNRAQLETILRGHNLTPTAIDYAWRRTQEVQNVLKDPESKITFVEDIGDKVPNDMRDKSNPFCADEDFKKNPSFFTDFNMQMKIQIKGAHAAVYYGQQDRMAKRGNYYGPKEYNVIDMEEYAEHLESENKKAKIAEYKKADRQSALLMDFAKIEGMDALMKRVNRLKSPSKEFGIMRDAMAELAKCAKDLGNKAKSNEKFSTLDYKGYEECLKNMNEATQKYIQKKGLEPKTEKGVERRDAAMSFLNRVDDLMYNFEADKKLDDVKIENPENDQDIDFS